MSALLAIGTGTLLVIGAAVVALGAALVGGFLFLTVTMIGKTARRDAEEAIQPLRDTTLQIFDRLEAAKARRDKLSGAGQAGVAPPTGELAAKLERASARISEAGTGWTELEERLRQCRALVDSETRFGRTKLDDARDLAKQKDVVSPRVKAALDEAEKLLEDVERGFLAAGGLVQPRTVEADAAGKPQERQRKLEPG
ncbi:MAG TPA: hypothetical protein VHF22_07790 [Planctomycetota bacterium]|nr:hypothetical protein [Planctomycetota bacterium]